MERGELADVDVGADLAQGLEALGPASGQTNAPWRIASTGPRGRLPARARGCRRAASSSRRRGAALSIPIHWRFRFLVASPPVPDLLLCAKHLFVAAGPWGVHVTSVGPAKVQKCTDGSAAADAALRCTHRGLTRVHAQARAANQMQILTPKPASHRTMLPVKTGPRRTRYPKAYVITGTASKTMIAHLL